MALVGLDWVALLTLAAPSLTRVENFRIHLRKGLLEPVGFGSDRLAFHTLAPVVTSVAYGVFSVASPLPQVTRSLASIGILLAPVVASFSQGVFSMASPPALVTQSLAPIGVLFLQVAPSLTMQSHACAMVGFPCVAVLTLASPAQTSFDVGFV